MAFVVASCLSPLKGICACFLFFFSLLYEGIGKEGLLCKLGDTQSPEAIFLFSPRFIPSICSTIYILHQHYIKFEIHKIYFTNNEINKWFNPVLLLKCFIWIHFVLYNHVNYFFLCYTNLIDFPSWEKVVCENQIIRFALLFTIKVDIEPFSKSYFQPFFDI